LECEDSGLGGARYKKRAGESLVAIRETGFGGFLLASQLAVPAKLTGAGFRFRHPTLDDALHDLIA
jgi:hypothetical protein